MTNETAPRHKSRRKKLCFSPQWEGPIAGWAHNYIVRNYWRVADRYEVDDLLQDAYLKFLRCKQRYGYVNEPKHFMALFKTAVRNHITDLANETTFHRDLPVANSSASDYAWIRGSDQTDNNLGYMKVLISEAPKEVQMLLQAFADPEFITFRQERLRGRKRRGLPRTRETTNEFFCRCLGLDPNEVNLADLVRELFST